MSELDAGHLLASADSVVRDDRFDLLIHALAQLPQDTQLTLIGRGAGLSPMRTLAQAYGLGDQVSFDAHSRQDTARLVYPSVANLLHAPIRPERSQGDPVVFDPQGVYPAESSVSTFGAFVERLSTKRTSGAPRIIEAHAGLRGQSRGRDECPHALSDPCLLLPLRKTGGSRTHPYTWYSSKDKAIIERGTLQEQLRFEHSMLSTRRLRSIKGIGSRRKD